MSLTKVGVASFAALAFTVFYAPKMQAASGTVILEGSDAIEFHCTEEAVPGACTYEGQVWKALAGASGKPIAVIEGNSPVALSSEGSGIVIDNFTSVAAAGTLSNFAAVYIEGDDGDNEGPEGDTAVSTAGARSALAAYLAGGGTMMIEDYSGGANFAFAVGTSGNSGIIGAYGSTEGDGCDDGEKVTAVGLANGFTQPPAISCWEHQGFEDSVYAPLGFTLSFFTAGAGMGGAGYSGLLSTGVTLSATPEPTSVILLSSALLAVAWFARKRISQVL